MIDLALFLKRNGYRPDQVQDFIPAPFDIATCMYHTGLDPFTEEAGPRRAGTCATGSCSGRCCSSSSRRTTSRSARRSLKAGRARPDRHGCDALIPPAPPREAVLRRREEVGARGPRFRPAPVGDES